MGFKVTTGVKFPATRRGISSELKPILDKLKPDGMAVRLDFDSERDMQSCRTVVYNLSKDLDNGYCYSIASMDELAFAVCKRIK